MLVVEDSLIQDRAKMILLSQIKQLSLDQS